VGGWTPYESTRLYKLRAKWARRATGKDARFNLVGTRIGRLKADVEYALGRGPRGRGAKKDTPHPHFMDAHDRNVSWIGGGAKRKRKGFRQATEEQMQAWEDLDLPKGKARGHDLDPDVDTFEPEAGEMPLPKIPAARQYLIPGQDTKGHAHRVYCRVMPAHYRAICALERSKAFGFRTVGDVFRWCIDFGVRELANRQNMPQISSALAQVDAIREVLLDEQYYMEYSTMFESMTATVNRHISSGATLEAVRLIAVVKHQIEQMSEPYWRDKYMEELMRHYGSYLDGTQVKGVSFGGGE